MCLSGYPSRFEAIEELFRCSKQYNIPIDVNVKDIYGNTALNVAVMKLNTDIAVLLLKNGADATSINSEGMNVLVACHHFVPHSRINVYRTEYELFSPRVGVLDGPVHDQRASQLTTIILEHILEHGTGSGTGTVVGTSVGVGADAAADTDDSDACVNIGVSDNAGMDSCAQRDV
jgi:hypothetical protein